MGKKKFDYVEGGKSALYINEVNCVRRTLSLFLKKAALKKDVQLKDYQQRAVDKIKRQGSLLVAHGTGTGKTVTGIGGFETLRGEGKAALGVGLASAGIYGAKKMIDQHRRKKEREKVASQQKTRAMKHPSRNEGRWDDLIFLPEGEEKELRGQYSRLRGGRRYTVNKRNQFIRMKLRGENPYSNQV